MAMSRKDQDQKGAENGPPAGAPRPEGQVPPPPDRPAPPEGFLPDDSFLLDVEDEAARTPAPTADAGAAAAHASAGEEWIVVDDDLTETEAAAEPVKPAAPAEPIEAAAAGEAQAPQTQLPKWYSAREEGELPAFVAEESGAEGAAAAIAAAPSAAGAAESAAQPAATEALVAPILPLERARRRKLVLAAAGLVVALGLAATLLFQSGGAPEGREVASVPVVKQPREPPPKPAQPVLPVEPRPEDSVPALPPPEPTPPEPIPSPPVAETSPTPPIPEPTEVARGPERAPVTHPAAAIDPGRRHPLPPANPERRAPPAAKDDTILQLKNGHTFRGRITRVRGSRVTLRVGNGDCVFDLSEVSLLDSSAPEYRRVDQMPEASVVLASGQHLRGRLLKQTEEHVVLVVSNGQVIFPRHDIKDVSFTGRIHF
jgi:hypothetical protein